ncbi:MAG TPA: leucine--tRNA ligase [Candidatus Saccharimonadia bacterium]|nr:leucine--tRNA ligase [Candidatus Saccharimonadia bacterium]
MKKYDPQQIEPKWQKTWADTRLYAAVTGDTTRDKYYMLTEFPYPSGAGLHAGHTREYTLGDVIARHKRMQGYNVLYPMGYDAFGLPTENYAIKHKIAPQKATADNIATFRQQFDAMGFSFDWDREVNTTDPKFYKWTQWLFLKFLEAGLAYQAEMAINWCPKEKTGLANEEVVNGVHERCGTPVEKKLLKQWMFRITDYADRLIDGLKTVDYPSRIADQQVNWIGRSEGAEITFKLRGIAGQDDDKHSVTVYTTRPDTLFGATFLVVSPEVADSWLKIGWKASDKVKVYIEKSLRESELSRQEVAKTKTGVDAGIQAVHPITGELMPVWVADYVLGGYGTGAIMAVPVHDERDNEFARQFSLPIKPVVSGESGFTGYAPLINSGQFDGLEGAEAKRAIVKTLEEKGVGKLAVKYKLRDWIFSRQHYWGEPIPIIHCPKDGVVPVPEDQLPVTLPVVENYEPTDTGESPLAAVTDWVNVKCPICGGPAKRETDTMPNWAGSNWYYLRYMDARNDQAFASREALEYWRMVDLYLGGMEHTTLHLLYSRFVHQFLYDQGLVPTPEPYAARRGQGIVLAADNRKMSKSIGNVINPTDIIATHGADTLRLYILFMAPYDETTPWSEERLNGASRFVYKVWNLAQELMAAHQFTRPMQPGPGDAFETAVDRATHKAIKKIHDDLHEMHFNTAVSALMEYVNFLSDAKTKAKLLKPTSAALAWRSLNTLVQLLAPITPHLSEELWRELGWEGSVHVAGWPQYDPELIKDDIITVVVQVNGRVRANLALAASASDDELTAAAQADPKVAKFLSEGKVVKTIVVPRKLVNFVVK